MHGQAQIEGAAQRGQALCGAQAAPVMVVAEYDLHGAAHVGVAAELGKVRHHHIRGQWHIALACHGGHAVQARGRVLVVLKHAAQLLHDLQAGFHGPVAVGVDAQRCAGERLGQRQYAGGLLLGRQRAGLELDALEAVLIDHAPGLGHQLGRRQGFAPGVGCIGLAHMLGVFVEQIGRVGHAVSCGSAQQVDDGGLGHLTLQVQHGDLEGADHLGHGLGDMGARGQRDLLTQKFRGREPGRSDQGGDTGLHFIEGPGREPDQGRCGLGQSIQHGLVAIALVDADQTGSSFDLDDGAQCPGLVNAGGVEQRRITEGNRRDADVADLVRSAHLEMTDAAQELRAEVEIGSLCGMLSYN